jgi:trigger factor
LVLAWWAFPQRFRIDRRHAQLKITSVPTGERQISLTIEVDEARLDMARKKVARQISREVNIPGFRKGRAPFDAIVQRLGQRVVREELVNVLAEDLYREALEREEIAPYAPGTLEETRFDPLTLTFTVPLAPDVQLGDYRSYRRPFVDPVIREGAVAEALETIREQNAILAPLDRPAAEGDLVVVELVGRTEEGGVFVQEQEAHLLLDPEAEEPVPGLIDALIGVQQDEERTFKLVLPQDFQMEELQASQAEFIAGVNGVYERIVPELDDDLARTVGNYDSFEELRSHVEQRLRDRQRADAESEFADRVLQDIVDQAVVSFPPVMLEEALDDAVVSYEQRIERQEKMLLADYLRIQGQSMETLREELSPEVERSIMRSLVLGELVRQERIEVSDEELERRIDESAEQYGEGADEVRRALSAPETRDELRNRMLAGKAGERLVAIAKGEAVEFAKGVDGTVEIEEPDELAQ